MIYATANAWAQDIKRKLNNVPFNIGPMANLIGLGAFACFAAAGRKARCIYIVRLPCPFGRRGEDSAHEYGQQHTEELENIYGSLVAFA